MQSRVSVQHEKCLGGPSPGCYGEKGLMGGRTDEGPHTLPEREKAGWSLVEKERQENNFQVGDLHVQMYEGTRGHSDGCPLCLVFHGMHSHLLSEGFLQLPSTVCCAHYWMSNALNKFYYFMLDVWGYPLIADSYYPETK